VLPSNLWLCRHDVTEQQIQREKCSCSFCLEHLYALHYSFDSCTRVFKTLVTLIVLKICVCFSHTTGFLLSECYFSAVFEITEFKYCLYFFLGCCSFKILSEFTCGCESHVDCSDDVLYCFIVTGPFQAFEGFFDCIVWTCAKWILPIK
jgi:hypothetical protein